MALTPMVRACEETDKGLYGLLLITMFSRHCGFLHQITQKAYKILLTSGKPPVSDKYMLVSEEVKFPFLRFLRWTRQFLPTHRKIATTLGVGRGGGVKFVFILSCDKLRDQKFRKRKTYLSEDSSQETQDSIE